MAGTHTHTLIYPLTSRLICLTACLIMPYTHTWTSDTVAAEDITHIDWLMIGDHSTGATAAAAKCPLLIGLHN